MLINRRKPAAVRPPHTSRPAAILCGFLAAVLGLPVHSAVNIPEIPLQAGSAVPPNIMFVLDDSGSMHWELMPDERIASSAFFMFPRGNSVYGSTDYENRVVSFVDTNARSVYSRASNWNSSFYDPTIEYIPWADSSGATLAPAVPAAAFYNAYRPGVGSLNLTIQQTQNARWLDGNTLTDFQNRSYWPITFYVYKGTGADTTASNYVRYQLRAGLMHRRDMAGSAETTVTTLTWGSTTRNVTQEVQNFANWFTYYRSRTLAARAGIGRAFAGLPVATPAAPAPRVGFGAINKGSGSIDGVSTGTVIRGVRSFEGADRVSFINELYTHVNPAAGTPLRRALGEVGAYYERSDNSGPWGAVPGTNNSTAQIACRQSFAILMTDGYWNGAAAVGGAAANNDGTAGTQITGPGGRSYTYSPVSPFTDNRSDTLADAAMYYWKNDLRPGLDNKVPSTTANPAFWQHMVTYGVGLGVRGDQDPDAVFAAIGTPNTITWAGDPAVSNAAKIDDLLHAAVNSRGGFFSAKDPNEFANGLRRVLTAISERVSSGSNVSANSVSIGTNTRVYQASFVAGQWTGEMSAFPVTATGIGATPVWRASQGISYAGRKVFTRTIQAETSAGGADFLWGSLTPAQQLALGNANVVNYIRGDTSNERQNGGIYRNRVHLLGDIVDSSPAYVRETNTVYVGANDGMLHAFNAATGQELFAYIPKGVDFAKLKNLSDPDYSHHYFVDGPVVVSTQAQTPGKNYLVGTLGRGGKGVFGLDVTNPSGFAATDIRWDRAGDANMGQILGRPIIAKLNNGDVGVIVGNGVNSTNNRAALFVLNITDGSVLAEIDTGVGTALAPNGLSTPRGWDADGDGTLDYVYVGDLQGNMWKFDLSSANANQWTNAANRSVLFTARDSSNKRQPITGSPTIAIDPASYKTWVFFGTGSYLAAGDPASLDVQTWYGLLDEGAAITGRSVLQQRNIVVAGNISGRPVRGFQANDVFDLTKKGWFIDLLTPPSPGTAEGERMVGDSAVVGNVLIAPSIIPSADPCETGGRGFINALSAFTGTSVLSPFFDVDGDGSYSDDTLTGGGNTVPVGSIDLGVAMPTTPTLIGNLLVVGGSTGGTGSVGVNNPANQGRISWREIVGD